MSLINEMLRDLDKRKKQGRRPLPSSEKPVAVKEASLSPKFYLLAGGILLLIGVVWGAMTLIPASFPVVPSLQKHLTVTDFAPEKKTVPAVVTTDEKQPSMATAVSVGADGEVLAAKKSEITLLGLGVEEADDSAQLSLTFAQLPEYRILQNGLGQAQLIISFSDTPIGENFEIPTLTGPILKRVSLRPQKQSLQLLVDLNKGTQVQSFQLIDDLEQGYRLLIEVVAVKDVVEQTSLPVSVVEETPQVLEINPDFKASEESKVSRNKNTLSPDQLAYNAGLKWLGEENWIAAEESFIQALLVNPYLQDARLRLVGILLQQKELRRADEVLQQGLRLTPDNPDIRKVYARLMLNGQRYREAIVLLQSEPLPAITQDLEYHALLAALFQESKQFEEASVVYGELLRVRSRSALWWMGMAISQDQLGNTERAKNAYQKAVNLPGLRSDLQDYVKSRLQNL